MYMRASLEHFGIFHILKLLFPSIFLLVLHILCLKNIFNFRCQITSAYIHSMQFPYYLCMVWCYINDSIPTHTNIEQMYVYASSGVMSQTIWGAQSLRGSEATERGGGCGGGCPPSHGRELFNFST